MSTLWTEGSWVRCARCGWLEHARERRCAQCGEARPLPPHDHIERAELAVVREPIEPQPSEPGAIRALVEALSSQPTLGAHARALAAMGGRAVLLAPSLADFARVATQIAEELAAVRGEITVFSPDVSLPESPSLRRVARAQDAALALLAAPLSLSRAQRAALQTTPWMLAAATDALARELESLYELLSLVRPELAGTERSFIARFGRVDRDGATLDDSALASVLARATLRVAPDAPLDEALAALDRWLAAAPRS